MYYSFRKKNKKKKCSYKNCLRSSISSAEVGSSEFKGTAVLFLVPLPTVAILGIEMEPKYLYRSIFCVWYFHFLLSLFN